MNTGVQEMEVHPIIQNENKETADMECIIWKSMDMWEWKIAVKRGEYIFARSQSKYSTKIDCQNSASFTIRKLSNKHYSLAI